MADRFRHEAPSWMDLVHRLDTRTCGPVSGCPVVVMVESPHDRKCDHLVPRILRGRNQSALFWNLLLDPLMGPCPVEVGHIAIEHTLELPLMQDQQVVQTLLPHTSHEAFADGIGSGCMYRRLKNLNGTRRRHASKARPKFAVVIPKQILGGVRQIFAESLGRQARPLYWLLGTSVLKRGDNNVLLIVFVCNLLHPYASIFYFLQ